MVGPGPKHHDAIAVGQEPPNPGHIAREWADAAVHRADELDSGGVEVLDFETVVANIRSTLTSTET